jgi:hypothetical protein
MSSAEGIGYVAFSRPINSKSTQIVAGLGTRCGVKAVDRPLITHGVTALCAAYCHCTGAEFLYSRAELKRVYG